MNLCLRSGLLRASIMTVFAFGLVLPSAVFAATEQPSTGTLVGAVTCGADETTPAANAVISVAGLNIATRADSDGRFTFSNVPAGQSVRIDAATDPQQSAMGSRSNVVAVPGQTLDIGSVDIAICPPPSTPTAVTTEQEMEQRGSPND